MTATAPESIRFSTRPLRPADHDYIVFSAQHSMRESNAAPGIPNTILRAQIKQVIANFKMIVAHPEGEEDEIAGWIAYRGDVVAWLFVKPEPWRGLGVGRLLWNAAGVGIECRALYGSRWALALAKQKGLRVRMAGFAEGTRLLMGAGS